MNKLELKHLAPYLPYGLHGFVVTNRANFEVEIVGWNYNTLKTSPSIHGYTHCPFEQFQPILHPLSDLVKPCLSEGKIPIVELAKIAFKKPDYVAWMEDGNCLVGYKSKSPSYLFSWSKSHCSFSVMDLFYSGSKWRANKDTFCSNQLALFEWLFEHHFDVYGLIDQNLAVDINKIEP